MTISGLVITTGTADECAALAETLASDRRFTVGQSKGNRLAVVLETPDDNESDGSLDEEICRWLWTLPGVALVDVAAIHLCHEVHENAP